MENFSLLNEIRDEIPVLSVAGYYEKPAGMKVNEEAAKHFESGKICLILDFSKCDVLSSPGVSTLVELAVDVSDNFGGSLFICGLDKLKEKVLKLVGLHTMAEVKNSFEEALQAAKILQGQKK